VKKLLKKNQLMITALAIMIAIAGYLQFAGRNLDDEYLTTDGQSAIGAGEITENLTADDLAAANAVGDGTNLEALDNLDGILDLSEDDLLAGLSDIPSLDTDGTALTEDYLTEGMDGNSVAAVTPEEGEIPGEAVFASTDGIEVLSEAKLLKEQTRAKNKETLLGIINSTGLTDVQKQEAVDAMVAMTQIAEQEAAAEILLEAKGFRDIVVSISDGMVDVVVNASSLSDAQRAQIEDIVKRKTAIGAQNIIISPVVSME
jgi:stage III sporulation protein AH